VSLTNSKHVKDARVNIATKTLQKKGKVINIITVPAITIVAITKK
jgi:hypothetical protein